MSEHDLLLLCMKFENHIRSRLKCQFHGWDHHPPLDCRNLYMNGHDGKIDIMARYLDRDRNRAVRWEDVSRAGRSGLSKLAAFLEKPDQPMEQWVKILTSTVRCHHCGHKLILETDGHVVRVAGDPCQYPNGYPEWTVQIDVPSGKLVMANCLHSWFPEVEELLNQDNLDPSVMSDISTDPGAHLYSSRYADAGMLVGFTGNECPGVYRVTGRTDKFQVGQPPVECPHPWLLEGTEEEVASICTDFWGFSMADLGKENPDHPHRGYVVEVPPGRYQMTYHRHRIDDPRDGSLNLVYATIERIDDP